MYKLTDKEIDDLMLSTGTYGKDVDDVIKKMWRDAYREVESETIKQIEDAGSIEKWYERGRC